MKILKKLVPITLALTFFIASPLAAFAATSPGLGSAGSFVILSDTYSNSSSGTTLSGDLGYTTPPATAPTVNGNVHMADSTYNQAGIDQGTALVALNNQVCDFNFSPGPIDLASDTTHGPVGVYTPGTYCITGAASVGGGGTITLNGAGTYIFRMDGALTTSANSIVTLANGASACDVWWTPTQGTTLGADSLFAGNNIDASGIAIGNNVTWVGRALAFGGTVSTDSDTLSAATCIPTPTPTPTSPDTSVADAEAAAAAARAARLASTGQNPVFLFATTLFLLSLGSALYFIRRKLV